MVKFLTPNEIARVRRRRLLLALLLVKIRRRRLQLARSRPTRPILQTRDNVENNVNLIPQMRLDDHNAYYNYFRMSPLVFNSLLSKVEPYIYSNSKFCNRKAIPPGLKLALTLRYLASGDMMTSLMYNYRIGKSTVSKIIRSTCNAIWLALKDEVLIAHNTEDDFKKIAYDFGSKWNFPNCVGAIDGKHVLIEAPRNCGSALVNNKKAFSVVLMAACDANYKFTFIHISAEIRQNDEKTFSDSGFGQYILNQELPLPQPIRKDDFELKATFVTDKAFPLRPNIMRSFTNKDLTDIKRIFNYRLSRAMQTFENTFGILASRWRIFRKPIKSSLETVDSIVKATVCLHNMLQSLSNMDRQTNQYCPPGLVDTQDEDGNIVAGQWRQMDAFGLEPVRNVGSNNHTQAAVEVRDHFAAYFVDVGRVEWQERALEVGLHD